MLAAYICTGLCQEHRFHKKGKRMVSLEEIIGRVIRRERQDHRMTIKELGDKAGLSEIYVGEIERGQKYPSSKVLESLAKALDIDLADLLELMAEEIRYEREPQLATNVIGFTIPSTSGQPRRLIVKKMVNMLDEGAIESLADYSAFLLSKHMDPH
jgi:transcriptional regulator with XRE-family HTH domain